MMQSISAAMNSKPQNRHKYIIIRDWLAEQIASGVFARGEQIPSEHELMDRFAVSRVTARQALSELKNSGLIKVYQGKGYFVSGFVATSNLERLQSFGEMMAPFGLETCSDIIELSEVRAGVDISQALNLQADALLTRIVRTRNAGGRTFAISTNHFPTALGRRIMCLDLAKKDIYELMEDRLRVDIAYADTVLDVTPVAELLGSFIGVKANHPVLRITRVAFDSAGVSLVHETTFAPLDAIKFKVRVPRW